jgi:hypothetical protein
MLETQHYTRHTSTHQTRARHTWLPQLLRALFARRARSPPRRWHCWQACRRAQRVAGIASAVRQTPPMSRVTLAAAHARVSAIAVRAAHTHFVRCWSLIKLHHKTDDQQTHNSSFTCTTAAGTEQSIHAHTIDKRDSLTQYDADAHRRVPRDRTHAH